MNDISVLAITYNEIQNIPILVSNVKGWAKEIIVLDSGSTDGTVEFLKAHDCKVFNRRFDNYSMQRKYLLHNIEILSEWVLVLDADEYLSEELKKEISDEIKNPKFDAYTMNRRFYWMGSWVKKGYYPTTLLRFGRRGILDCEDRPINEHLISHSSKIGSFKNDFIDENKKGLDFWFQKHNNYSKREAEALFADDRENYSLLGGQYERKRWIRKYIWNRMPPFFRSLTYLIYRLFIRAGILDGKQVILYHFLHAFVYRCMIDAKYLEKKWNILKIKNSRSLSQHNEVQKTHTL